MSNKGKSATAEAPVEKPKKGQGSAKPTAQTAKQSSERKVIFTTVEVANYSAGTELGPVTPALARDWLGWEDEEQYKEALKQGKTKLEPLLADRKGRQIRCRHNVTNRPLYLDLVRAYMQTVLNKQWAGPSGCGGTVNGENLIIGETGLILDAQHRLIALVLCEQERTGDVSGPSQAAHWAKFWPTECVIDSLVVTGISESDKVVNTMNTGKPRSLSDALYRSEYLSKYKTSKVREQLASMCDYSIRLLWDRTWASKEAWAPRRTHAEALDFLARHEKHLLKYVDVIYQLDREVKKKEEITQAGGRISRFLHAGLMPAVTFMMASSTSKGGNPVVGEQTDYRDKEGVTSEKKLKWDNEERAEQFLRALADSTGLPGDPLAALWKLRRPEPDDKEGSPIFSTGSVRGIGTRSERMQILSIAWKEFCVGNNISEETFPLSEMYKWTGEEFASKWVFDVATAQTFGGIDLGPQGIKSEREEESNRRLAEEAANRERMNSESASEEKRRRAEQEAAKKAKARPGSNGDGSVKREPGEVKPSQTRYGPDGLPAAPKLVKGKKGKEVAPEEAPVEADAQDDTDAEPGVPLEASPEEQPTVGLTEAIEGLDGPSQDDLDALEEAEGLVEEADTESPAESDPWALIATIDKTHKPMK